MQRLSPLPSSFLRPFLLLLLLPLLTSFTIVTISRAQAPPAALPMSQASLIERQVKAAYLVKFAGFVEWPGGSFAQADTPLQIGIVDNEFLADQLEQLEQMVTGRTIAGHPITVRRLRHGDALAGLHVLFLGGMERAAISEIVNAARGLSMLTVTDGEDGLALGCMISFVVAADKLRFNVGLRQVTAGGLRISARMLAAAHQMQGAS